MDYYLCKTDGGPQLAATQADAKVLDKKFEPYVVDTAKKPLMDFINHLLDGTSELCSKPAPSSAPAVDAPIADAPTAPPPNYHPKILGACPACSRTPLAAKRIAASNDLTEVQVFIENLPADQSWVLDRLQDHIDMRRREIAATIPTPPARRRA